MAERLLRAAVPREKNVDALGGVTLPDSVTTIGEGAFAGCPANLTLTVGRDSYAAEYASANGIMYTYPDANDWLYS